MKYLNAVLGCLLLMTTAGAGCQKDEGLTLVELPDGQSDDTLEIANASDGGKEDGRDAAEDRPGDGAPVDAPAPDDVNCDDAGDAIPDSPEASVDLPIDVPVDVPLPSDLREGQACQAGSWCRSGFCVDGVCCNTACEGDDPLRCSGCSLATSGQRDGLCAPSRVREGQRCGLVCGQLAMNVPSVLEMICLQGRCAVSDAPRIVDTCSRPSDACAHSFCDQPTSRIARCVNALCPQRGTCCCQDPGNAGQRSCLATSACNSGRMCVSQ